MTEQEAKTKWCPFARLAGASYNRSTDDKPISKCIASDCMAWRKQTGFMWGDDKDEIIEVGFCGLAGAQKDN